ncbi:hypothetical protein [Streptomyces noursei]|uniref:hypothetical protein n=1 Tax=Streptomyces noursei TaxID=1971 RepID=UPI0016783B3C|nr:hypothetical protein [Streptomyces noursei]MCZ1019376.1 hypothetical protein [Streptomyces noursei]GGX07982.1 hypothetical protein GCM10010341_31940 [Streptomyces noursei]
MDVILDVKFNEFAREYAERERGYPNTLNDMADAAREMCWAGFGMVDDGTGEPLEDWQACYYYNCDCQENLRKVNAEVTHAAFKSAGVETFEWRGWIVWDASNQAGHEIARSIGNGLAHYPILDDERLSEIEWDNACEMIADLYTLPEGVEPDDLIRIMPEVPHCSNCSSCDVEDAMETLGYLQCQDCNAWLKTAIEGAMCHECTEREQEGECECVPAYVHTLKHVGAYATMGDIREIQRGCETCYPVRWPHGGAKLGI